MQLVDLAVSACRFPDDASCWVSCDVAGGKTNHESGDNFTLTPDGSGCLYELKGTTLFPSWHLD